MTMAAGTAALLDNDYYMDNCRKIIETREDTKRELAALGFARDGLESEFSVRGFR